MPKSALKPFLKYIGRRLFFLVLTYLVAITIIFILPRAIPGNPLATLLQRIAVQGAANPETVSNVHKALMEEFDIDKPIIIQYLRFIGRLFTGNLGTSIHYYPKKCLDVLAPFIPWTLFLLIPATLTAWIIGNTLGAVAGNKRGTWIDNIVLNSSLVISQIPYYWLGMLLIYTFAVKLNIFPNQGGYSQGIIPSLNIKFILDVLHHYILPFLSIVIAAIGGWAIGTRLLVIYELDADYTVFAVNLGMRDSTVFKYVFRNILLPQITGLALNLGSALGGALITELIFNYPGTGYILFRALSTLDYPLIQAIFVILIVAVYLANFIVDFVYAIVDPRIRLGQGEGS
uniref:ABC transporter permease n=1 Tax=Dictyoglomus thermophilum TaxID=14 RepID=A0A7C3RL07_DICTH